MNVFELQGSISMDSSGFDKAVKDAVKAGQDLVNSLQANTEQAKAMEAEISRLRAEANSSKTEFAAMRASLDNIEKAINSNSKATNELTEALKEEKRAAEDASQPTEELGKEVDDLGDKSSKAESRLSGLASFIRTGLVAACTVAVTSITAASAAVAGLTKSSVGEYSNYEQLAGGVDIMFKNSASTVKKNAQNAWKTIGVSENEYMATITSFSSSLIQSIGKSSKESSEITQATIAEVVKAYDDEYKAAKRSYSDQYDTLSEALADEVTAYKKASDEKISTVKREYDERMRLVDEEANAQMAAIDDQIAAINELAAAENAEKKKRKQEEKQAELEDKVRNARSSSERFKAERELNAYIKEINEKNAEEEKEAERKAQIDKLKAQKEDVKTAAQQKKEALKAQRDEELAALKEAQETELTEIKRAQKAQLRALKNFNEDRLDELKDYYTKQKALYTESIANGDAGLAELTAQQYEEAAALADMALNDMSDNASVFGTNMQSIQNAYAGFAKQNYMMLDNLRLGYGGTKTEMERLLKDAEAISGVKYDISNYSDIIKAIHEIQSAQNITGNAAKEAEKTLSGSLNATKSSWKNLILEIAKDNGDVEGAFKKFEASADTYIKLLVPRIEIVLKGIAEVIPNLIDSAFEHLPEIIGMLGSIVKIGAGIVTAVCKGIYNHRSEIKDELGRIPDYLNNSISAVNWGKVGSTISSAITGAIDFATDFVESIDWEALGTALAEAFNGVDWIGVIKSICDFMIAAIKAAPDLIRGIVTSLDWDDVATVAALAFVPIFLKLLASEIAASSLWKDITSVFTTKMGEAGAASVGSRATGMGFLGKFSLVLGAGIAGWELGSWIYDQWEDEIDETVELYLNKTGLGKLLVGRMTEEERKAALKELQEFEKKNGGISTFDWWNTDEVERLYEEGLNDPKKTFAEELYEKVAADQAQKALESLEGFIKPQGVRSYSASPSMSIGNVTINMEGMEISSDYGTDRFVERINEQLQLLMARENAAVGGANW